MPTTLEGAILLRKRAISENIVDQLSRLSFIPEKDRNEVQTIYLGSPSIDFSSHRRVIYSTKVEDIRSKRMRIVNPP